MIRLDSTTRKLQIVLGGAVTTNQLPVIVSYSDKTATAYTGGTQRATTNNTTAVDICAAPAASTVRDIDNLTVYNKDTATATATILYDDNGTDAELIKAVLLTNEQLVYTHGSGWKVLDSAGATKTTANTVPTTSAALAAQLTDETGSGALVFANGCVLTPSSVQVTSANASGYGTGAGGTVTQITSKSTAVEINKPTGQITMHDASLAAGATVAFLFSNSVIALTDVVAVTLQYLGNAAQFYNVWAAPVGAAQAVVYVKNIDAGARAEALVINFAIIKGATS